MGRICLLVAALTAVLISANVFAQTTVRCDLNGSTTYSDKPCPPGNSTRSVALTQETAEQKAASKAANEQMRKDGADLNQRLTEREKIDAKERAEARKAAAKLRVDAAKEKTAMARKIAKANKSKAPKKPTKKKTKASDNTTVIKP